MTWLWPPVAPDKRLTPFVTQPLRLPLQNHPLFFPGPFLHGHGRRETVTVIPHCSPQCASPTFNSPGHLLGVPQGGLKDQAKIKIQKSSARIPFQFRKNEETYQVPHALGNRHIYLYFQYVIQASRLKSIRTDHLVAKLILRRKVRSVIVNNHVLDVARLCFRRTPVPIREEHDALQRSRCGRQGGEHLFRG